MSSIKAFSLAEVKKAIEKNYPGCAYDIDKPTKDAQTTEFFFMKHLT